MAGSRRKRIVDDEEEEEGSSSKQARVEDEEAEEQGEEEQEKEDEEEQAEEEEGEAVVDDDMLEDDDDDDDDDDEEEAIAPRKINLSGKTAEAGIIKRVQVENFMCHRKLTVDLCPNVNFIHGQNGSGKSAILAAVQICLGAGARRTHRARNLAELIRKESNTGTAKIQVTLRNEGDDGFQREIYGDSITVERIITNRAGGGGYKLLDEHGKSKSKAKKDLDAMLDQLNIQVENPVAVLDQEDAKKFLTGKPEDKYNFFAKATDLERMDRTYGNVVDSIAELKLNRLRVSQSLVGAVANVRKLKKEVDQHGEIEKWEDKIGDFTRLQAWAAFGYLNTDYQGSEHTFELAKKKLADRQADVAKIADQPSMDEEKNSKQARLEELSNESSEASNLKREVEKQLKIAQQPIRQVARNKQQLEKEIRQAEQRLAEAQKRLKDARVEMQQREAESEQAQRLQELEQLRGSLVTLVEEEKVLREQQANALREYQELEPVVESSKSRAQGVESQVKAVQHKIRQLQSNSGGSQLAMFGGSNAAKLAAEVARMQGQRKWKGKVIGPIGAYMKIAPGKERYAKLAELALGGGLDRFIVTNADDKATFMRLRNEIGCRRECNIYSVTPAPRYQIPLSPVEGIVTVASCFTIEDDLVFNTLADQCKFDTKAIGDSKEDTEQLLLQTDNRGNESIRGGKIAEVSFFPKGDVWTINKQGSRNMRSNERQLKQTIGADNQSAIAQANEEIQQLKHELHEHQKQHEAHKMQILKAKKAWNEVKKAQRNAKQAIEELENNISHLQTEVDASTSLEETDTTELEEDVTNIEEDLTVLNEKLEANDREKEEFEPEIDRLEQKVEEVEARNERILADMEIAEKDLTVFISKSSEREEAKEKADKKLEKIQATLVEMTSALAEKRGDFDAALRTARLLQYRHEYAVQMKAQAGEREEGAPSTPDLTPEDPEDEELEAVEIEEPPKEANYYEAKIARLRLRIQEEREKRSISNVSFEESYERYQRAKNLLESKNKQLEQIAENVEKLAKDLASRKKRWKTFRKHLVTMSQSTFDEILQLKGSAGDLDFNHDDKTLNLVVQKDNTDASSQTKDVKALSGGERSFVTLSLLLAIGERLETPFRVMDEFDVFLDPVSRKIAMDTLVEIAKKMDHRQFILITPQDLSNITPDDKVKIFKLLPPARSNAVTGLTQQTLD